MCIRADAVRVGDQLFNDNNGKAAPCYWWHNVTKVTVLADNNIEIQVGGWAGWLTRKHPAEAVTIKRPAE